MRVFGYSRVSTAEQARRQAHALVRMGSRASERERSFQTTGLWLFLYATQ
jgi:hypothetical protein